MKWNETKIVNILSPQKWSRVSELCLCAQFSCFFLLTEKEISRWEIDDFVYEKKNWKVYNRAGGGDEPFAQNLNLLQPLILIDPSTQILDINCMSAWSHKTWKICACRKNCVTSTSHYLNVFRIILLIFFLHSSTWIRCCDITTSWRPSQNANEDFSCSTLQFIYTFIMCMYGEVKCEIF